MRGTRRLKTVSASSGQNPVTNTVYNTASQVTEVNFGSLDKDTFQYDANTGRLTQYKFFVGTPTVIGNLTWNANGSLKTLGITDPFNAVNTQTCNYGYDDLARQASANCGTAWNQSFAFDPFGNISKTATVGTSFAATYAPATNRLTLVGSAMPTYDLNGNLTKDENNHLFAWDAEGRMLSVDSGGASGICATYDALGRQVEKATGSTCAAGYVQIVNAPSGGRLATMSGQTLQQASVPLVSGGEAAYNASGLLFYRHADHLGSSRFASTPVTRAKYFDVAYAPYGEDYAGSGTTDLSFTDQKKDTASWLYDFMFRKYNAVHGRWMSPDPAGSGAADPSAPQTWNRYAYVSNNPLSHTDPTGLFDDAIGCSVGCGGGGVYAAPNFFTSQIDASNRNPDLSFDRWVDWNTHETFGDRYYDLPGHSNPIQQALDQYLDMVEKTIAAAGGLPDELYLKAISDCAGSDGTGDRTVQWMLMNTAGKDYWVFEHLDRPGRISRSGFGPQVSKDGPSRFEDTIVALPPFGIWNQTFTASRDPNNPNGSQLPLLTSSYQGCLTTRSSRT